MSLYFIILSLAMLLNRNYYRAAVTALFHNGPVYFIASVFALIIGILLIVFHNVWVQDWPIIITLISWVIFMKGVLLLLFPKEIPFKWQKNLFKNKIIYIWAIFMMCLGLYLGYRGFFYHTL
jgi:hypothetical protein